VCSLLFEERLKVGHRFIYGLERDVRDVMQYPAHMVGSDSIFYGGSPHSRAYRTFPRYLGAYSRELGLLRLEEAVRKMTSFPA
jgi:N-acyl-D-amino-acid deacylase